VDEPQPGPAWRERFEAMWPAYRAWYLRDGDAARPNYPSCRRALAAHMPELVDTYDRVVELAGGGDLAARLLSLYRPPAFIVGCSQGAWTRGEPALVRNYDYPVSRLEGLVCLTAWDGHQVIGMSDCLWGLLDGINDAGLAVSLTFGGRREVGDGFAVPLVVRYLLETCDTVAQAGEALARIPVHAAQNVTVLDAGGDLLTAYVGPGRPPQLRRIAATTNHQGEVAWPEYVRAVRSVEREQRVLELLDDGDLDRERFVAAFLEPPLHSTGYVGGFGTIYTAAYYPAERRVEYRWPGLVWEQSFDDFRESSHTVTFADGTRAAR
jgi:predicted choloylglycine hydrolase